MRTEIFGYARVSARDQNEERQFLAMMEAGVPRKQIYTDKKSGKDFERPQYQKLIRRLKKGSVLYVLSIDRLGRNYEEIIDQWRRITKEKEADIVVLDMPLLDTRRDKNLMGTFVSDLVLQILSFCAANERENIRQRQKEGIKAAKARGVKFGRPQNPVPDNFGEMCEAWEKRQIKLKDAAEKCGMPLSTFYTKCNKTKKSF